MGGNGNMYIKDLKVGQTSYVELRGSASRGKQEIEENTRKADCFGIEQRFTYSSQMDISLV